MRLGLFVFFLLLSEGISAADWSGDSSDTLNIKLGFTTSVLGVDTQFIKRPSNGVELKYSPDSTTSSFVSFGYRNIGFGLGSSNPQTPDRISNFGKTTGQDYQIKLFGKRMTHEFIYQKYAGYFISNSEAVDSSYNDKATRIIRSDMETEKYGVNLIYNFQPDKFSLNAAFSHGAVQNSTSGSWLGVVILHNNVFNSSPQLIPTSVAAPYGTYGDIKSGKTFTAGGGIGYGLNLVASNFYAALQLIVGWSSQDQTLTHATGVEYKSKESSDFSNVKIGLGYNGKNNYIGFNLLTDASNFKSPDGIFRVSQASSNVSLFYGHRFEGVNLAPLNPVSSLFD